MTSFVLTHVGELAELEAHLAALSASHPSWRVTRKLATVFELECEGELPGVFSQLSQGEAQVWQLREMTYAEIAPPSSDLRGLQRRLAQLRGSSSGSPDEESSPSKDKNREN